MMVAGSMKHPTELQPRAIDSCPPLNRLSYSDKKNYYHDNPLAFQIHLAGIFIYDINEVMGRFNAARHNKHMRSRPVSHSMAQAFVMIFVIIAAALILFGITLARIEEKGPSILLLMTICWTIPATLLVCAYLRKELKGHEHRWNKTHQHEHVQTEPLVEWRKRFDLQIEHARICDELKERSPRAHFFIESLGVEHAVKVSLGHESYYICHWRGGCRKHTYNQL